MANNAVTSSVRNARDGYRIDPADPEQFGFQDTRERERPAKTNQEANDDELRSLSDARPVRWAMRRGQSELRSLKSVARQQAEPSPKIGPALAVG